MQIATGRGRAALAIATILGLALPGAAGGTARATAPEAVVIDDACDEAPDGGFSDTDGTTFEHEIDCLAWYGISKGTGDGSQYEPLIDVPRWQMATFVHRFAQYVDAQLDEFALPTPSDQGFEDIGALDDEFQDAVNVLAEIGVVAGSTPTRFDPYSDIRRDQMASFLNRLQGAIQAQLGGDPDGFDAAQRYFPDVDETNVHHGNVDGLASAGIVQGRADGRYHPRASVTRGQMAAFIARHVEVNVDDARIDPKSADEPADDPTGPRITAASVITNLVPLDGTIGDGDALQLQFDEDMSETAVTAGAVMTLRDADGTTVEVDCGVGCQLGGAAAGDDVLLIAVGPLNTMITAAGGTAGLAIGAEIAAMTAAYQDVAGNPVDLSNSADVILD